MLAHRALVFPVMWSDPRLDWLLAEFRLIVNESIRISLQGDHRSRARLTRAAYGDLSARHVVHKKYIPSAFGVALSVLKVYRRRMRKGKRTTTPFMRRLMLKAENQSYWLDRETGRLRIPIRGTEGVQLHLPLCEWHRSILSDPSWGLGSLTVVPGKIIVVVRKDVPKPYEPEAAIALDTNEDSLDGVVASSDSATLVRVPFDGVRRIQEIHFQRRRRLARKKSNDRRVARRLLDREGRRERHRVRQRLHRTSKGIVRLAAKAKAAIVLEDLMLHGAGARSHRMNRRLSAWPRREIHRQIEYKTALASNGALARAVRFRPGALRHDVVSPLYDLLREGGGAREEPSGVESLAGAA